MKNHVQLSVLFFKNSEKFLNTDPLEILKTLELI